MDRPDDYRRFLTWAPGSLPFVQHIQFGGLGAVAANDHWTLGLLRVGYQGALSGPQCEAWVRPADGGSQIGDESTPIDVPLALVCEQPVTVFVRPVERVVSSAIRLMLSVTKVFAPSDRLYATRTLIGLAGTAVVLPQWVRGVAAISPSTFSWIDRSGAVLGGVQSGAHDRPATAVALMPVVGGPISLYF